MDKTILQIEALIFASDHPVTLQELQQSIPGKLDDVPMEKPAIEQMIGTLKEKYSSDEYSFNIEAVAGGYQFLSKGEFHPVISSLLNLRAAKRLSGAALETLSIIAYKQPVTKTEIEGIRGVNCDYTVHKLLEKELISIAGRAQSPGNPILYTTSQNFMEHFGLNSEKDLPKLKEIDPETNFIGDSPEITEPTKPDEVLRLRNKNLRKIKRFQITN